MISIINQELEVKNTESTIKNKLKISLNEMKVLKFVIGLVLRLNKNEDETKYSAFFQAQRTQTLIIYLNQSLIPL